MKKLKPRLNVIYGLFFLFFVTPSLLALVSTIGFFSMYFLMTHPIFAEYQNQLSFKMGIINVAFGVCFAQVIIIFKSINYVFREENEKSNK